MSSVKWRQFCLSLNVLLLTHRGQNKMANIEQFFIHSKAKLILITA